VREAQGEESEAGEEGEAVGEGEARVSAAVTARRESSVQARREGGHVAEMQRRRLLLAICEVVAGGGLEAATVGRVCEQAGVSRRTFYELFSDREDCLLAAFDHAVARIAEWIAPAFADGGSWRERVGAALSLLLEWLDAQPAIARFCVVESSRAGPLVLERRRRALEVLASAVDEGRAGLRSAPPPLTAQGVVGGALSVIYGQLLADDPSPAETNRRGADADPRARGAARGDAHRARPLAELAGPLTAMIVHPYLGAAAARAALERPAPVAPCPSAARNGADPDPFRDLPIRFTYRTARVLATIAADAGASNRQIAERSGIADDGQVSRLLRRLQASGLIENRGQGHPKGGPNAWALTPRGQTVSATIAQATQ
jgi:AcrR family transcriptional regulator